MQNAKIKHKHYKKSLSYDIASMLDSNEPHDHFHAVKILISLSCRNILQMLSI